MQLKARFHSEKLNLKENKTMKNKSNWKLPLIVGEGIIAVILL